MDDRYVGELTSAGYSRALGRAVAFVYARSANADTPLTDAAIDAARYAVDIAGTMYSATVHRETVRP